MKTLLEAMQTLKAESEESRKVLNDKIFQRAKKRFSDLCYNTGREHIPEEENFDKWTLRDFISEAAYQMEMRSDESDLRDEYRKYKRFILAYKDYLTPDIKCFEEHVSDYDLL